MRRNAENISKIIKSSLPPVTTTERTVHKQEQYHFIDTLAIIQDITFKLEEPETPKLHWWNKLGIWLINLRRG